MGVIKNVKRNLARNKVYRKIKNTHDYVCDELEYSIVFPFVLGFIGWPITTAFAFSKGLTAFGVLSLFMLITYWLHLILLED